MILTGQQVQDNLKDKMTKKIKKIDEKLKFVVIQVGDNESSNKYIKNKIKFAQSLGILGEVVHYADNVEEELILNKIINLNYDKSVHGILVQLPLPKKLNEYKITQQIDYKKDIDGFNSKNIGNMYLGKNSLISCTPKGIIELLNYYHIDISGKNVVIAGRSNIVGKGLAILLVNSGATVTICNSKTKNIKEYINSADIFVSAIGKPKYFTREYFENSNKLVIIDVGINFENNKLVGDIDFENVHNLVKAITPVPGGIGILTVTMLMQNLITAYEIQKKKSALEDKNANK